MFYSIIGIALLLLSAVTIGCMAAFEIRDRKGDKIQSGKKRSKKPYSQAFLDAIPRAYESSGTLRGMLTLLLEQCPKENGRVKAALHYLSDSSDACEKQIGEVLKREIQKTTALTCH